MKKYFIKTQKNKKNITILGLLRSSPLQIQIYSQNAPQTQTRRYAAIYQFHHNRNLLQIPNFAAKNSPTLSRHQNGPSYLLTKSHTFYV